MKKNHTLLTLLAGIFWLHACNPTQNSSTPAASIVTQGPNDSLFTVNEEGYQFAIYLPKDLIIDHEPDIEFNSASGNLNIRIGDQFWIVASQEQKDFKEVKSEINDNMLFSCRVIEDTGSAVLYQRILPDGKAYDYNYRAVAMIGGKPYFFRTCEEGEYSRESVELMRSAILSAHTSM